jgi:hypothetical protein
MNKNNLIYYIGIVILYSILYIMGVLGDVFIKIIILILSSIFGVMENDYISISKRGLIK